MLFRNESKCHLRDCFDNLNQEGKKLTETARQQIWSAVFIFEHPTTRTAWRHRLRKQAEVDWALRRMLSSANHVCSSAFPWRGRYCQSWFPLPVPFHPKLWHSRWEAKQRVQTWYNYPWPWVSLTWLLYKHHGCWFRKFTVWPWPIRKELEIQSIIIDVVSIH